MKTLKTYLILAIITNIILPITAVMAMTALSINTETTRRYLEVAGSVVHSWGE